MKNSFWSHTDVSPDTYSLFRGSFVLTEAGPVEFSVIGASWYEAWLDGTWLLEGPPRYPLDRPEYQTQVVDLPAGEHLLAFHVHHIGVLEHQVGQVGEVVALVLIGHALLGNDGAVAARQRIDCTGTNTA